MKVIIIGAGLAGLSAAYDLSELGHDTVVLEARNRVGGRTWSDPVGDAFAERGAEFISRRDFAAARMAARLGVPMISHGVRFDRRTYRGKHITPAELEATLHRIADVHGQMVRDGARRVSVAELGAEALGSSFDTNPVYRRLITSIAGDPAIAHAANIIAEMSSGRRGGADGALNIADDGRYVGDDGHFMLGNQSLSSAIAAALPTPVRLESPVAGVEQSATGCQVRLLDGTTVDGDHVVVAVPLLLLTELDFGFDVPAEFTTALSHLEMGVAAKFTVSIDPAARLDTAVQTERDTWWYWQSLAADAEYRAPMVTCFAGGQAALESLKVGEGPETWLAALAEYLPADAGPHPQLLTDWRQDPWARGAYSYTGLDWQPEDVAALQRPIGRVAFAGEHIGLDQTINGAIASGQHAAATLQALGAG